MAKTPKNTAAPAAPTAAGGIKVRARLPGLYGTHRRPGEVFDWFPLKPPQSPADFPRWMEPVDWTPPEAGPPPPAAAA